MPRKRKLHPIEKADLKVARKVALDRNGRWGRWTARFAELGDQPPLVALSLGVAGLGAVRSDERMARMGLRMLAAHSLATMAKLLGKNLVDRTRPGALKDKAYRMERGTSHDGRLRSMPSGHSAGVTAVAGAVAEDYPALQLPAALASAAVAAAQPPSRNHYLSDVVVGAGIGIGVAAIARWLIPPQDELEAQPRPARLSARRQGRSFPTGRGRPRPCGRSDRRRRSRNRSAC